MRSLALALVVGLAYFLLIAFGEALGESRKVAPWAAVWIANAVFAVAGLFLLKRING